MADLGIDTGAVATDARTALIAAGEDTRGVVFVSGPRTYALDRRQVDFSISLLELSGGRRRLFNLTKG